MSSKVLIVEDEILIALETEAMVEDLGHRCTGIAATAAEALALADADVPDIALIDVNLADGSTGPQLGASLADRGVAVVFVTANPRMLAHGVAKAVGFVDKPLEDRELAELLAYVTSMSSGTRISPPRALHTF